MSANRLGRNLNALLGLNEDVAIEPKVKAAPVASLRTLPVEVMQRGQYQPRNDIAQEALEELAESIRSQGVIQPIVVRPISDERYEIIAGERRWRASQLAGLEEVPVVIKQVNDEAAMAMALIENIQREDLNPMEEARALHRLQHEFTLTHKDIARVVGKSRTTVTNLLRLLNLNEDVKTLLENGDIEMGHARALLTLAGEQQSQVARTIVAQALTVRQTEKMVQQIQAPKTATAKSATVIDPNIRDFENQLSEKLAAKVKIQHKKNGAGELVVHYNTLDELEGILAHIR